MIVARSGNRWHALVIGVALALINPTLAAQGATLWQSNSDGDDIHIFDATTLAPRGRLVVGLNPHGLATDARQRIVYVTLERNGHDAGELLWIDVATRQIVHRMTVGPEPHQLAVTPDGAWAYVPCRDGHYWVIDTQARKVVKKIETGGRPHNTTVSPDGRFAYLSPMGGAARVTVVSIADGHEVVGEIPFSDSVRPPAINRSGKQLFQHVDGLNGFEVASTRARQPIARVVHSTSLGWFLMRPKLIGWFSGHGFRRCHGLAIRPGDREVWSVCGNYLSIHDAIAPYTERAMIELPSKGYWLAFHPNSQYVYVALSGADQVAIINADARTLKALIDVGRTPKRNLVLRGVM
ncbi:MAG: hypothetical protein K0U93_03255 [Gammaproteobacteria bacterium]|nr:hypothetical protein [Gammaproteobacteria bacterium]